MLESLILQEDTDATSELRKSFARRGIVVHLGKQCTKVEDTGSALTVHFGEGETVECDLMLVSVGRALLVEKIGLEAAGVTFDKRAGVETDGHRRTSVPHVYAAGDVAGYWQLAHTSFREGEVAAENAAGHEAQMPESPAVPRPIYTDPEIAGVGLTEAEAVEKFGAENIAVGRFPWVANARAVMTGDTTGWVKSIHETTYGELVGVVIVGPHATDLIEAGVVALDAEATIETVADGWRRTRRSRKGSRKRVWLRSAARFTSRRAADRQRVGYPASMSFYNRRNAAVGYLTLKAVQRAIENKRRKRRSGMKVAAYVGLGLVSAGILAAVLAIALKRRQEAEEIDPRDRRRDRRRVRHRPGARTGHVSESHGGDDASLIRPALAGLVPYEPGKPVEEVSASSASRASSSSPRTKGRTALSPRRRRRSPAQRSS